VRVVSLCAVFWCVPLLVQAQTASQWVDRAEQLIREGNSQGALDALAHASQTPAASASLEDRIGFLLAVLHQPVEEAVPHFRKAIALNPNDAAAHYHLGAALMMANQTDEGLAELKKATELAPNVFDYQFHLARAYETKGDLTNAATAYAQALKINPANDQVRDDYAYVLIATRQSARGIEESRKVLAHHPSDINALMNIGYAYLETGQFDAAEKIYRQLLAINPKLAAAHYDLGLALKMKDQLEPAQAEFKAAIEADPSLAQAYYSLGITYWQTGNFDETIRQMRAAISVKPDYAEAHYMLGIVLKQTGDLDNAMTELKTAIHLDPTTPGPYNTLGQILRIKGDKQGSEEAFAMGAKLKREADAQLANTLEQGMRGGEFPKPVVLPH
jgi:protein O-GlcNAc transferase